MYCLIFMLHYALLFMYPVVSDLGMVNLLSQLIE